MAVCNICGSEEFKDFNGRPAAMCKKCGSLERQRSLRWCMEKLGALARAGAAGKRALMLAPEKSTFTYLACIYPGLITADACPEKYPYAQPLRLVLPQDFSLFPDDYFDLMVHNHVLEHIPGDYHLHLIEFLRLLKPGGRMLFTTPLRGKQTIQGGESLPSDEERIKAFGQADHFKIFGADLLDTGKWLRGNFYAFTPPPDVIARIGSGESVFALEKPDAAAQEKNPQPVAAAPVNDIWADNLGEEVNYWRAIMNGTFPKKERCAGFRRRLTGNDIAHPRLHKYLEKRPRIIDVGAGPATVIGRTFRGDTLDITAIDPLAREYDALFQETGLTPCVRTIYGLAEEPEKAIAGKFGLVYSRNALDHARDPFRAIVAMLALVEEGGALVFENNINEGQYEEYRGLHQWNLQPLDGDLLIWNKNGDGKLLGRALPQGSFRSIAVNEPEQRWVFVEIMK